MPHTGSGSGVLRFDTFELDLRAGGIANEASKAGLQGQPVNDSLRYCCSLRPILWTREELRSQLWAGEHLCRFRPRLQRNRRIRERWAIRRRCPDTFETLPAPRIQIHCAVRGSPGAPDSGNQMATNTR